MELYLILLKALFKGNNYRLYRKGIDASFIDTNYPELSKLYRTLDDLQERETKDYSLHDLKIRFYTLYPKIAPKSFEALFQAVAASQYDERTVEDYLVKTTQRAIAFQLAQAALHVADGRKDADTLIEAVTNTPELLRGKTVIGEPTDEFVTDDLEALYESRVKTPGLRWRMQSFNKALGSLRKGNFGFLYARPEAGKSTFTLSETTHMATQADGLSLWFDNEEEGQDVKLRAFQSALGLTSQELYADLRGNQNKYNELMKGRFKIASGSISKRYVEEACKRHDPKLIILNQIDKITGFAGDRYDLVMKSIYAWARELAKQYGPVIGICQAGGSAEDKKYLTMTDVDSSYTAKQGEADWILGIGQVPDPGHEYIRYFSLSKNKLAGDSDTDPTMRHHKWSGLIVPERARFRDFDD